MASAAGGALALGLVAGLVAGCGDDDSATTSTDDATITVEPMSNPYSVGDCLNGNDDVVDCSSADAVVEVYLLTDNGCEGPEAMAALEEYLGAPVPDDVETGGNFAVNHSPLWACTVGVQ